MNSKRLARVLTGVALLAGGCDGQGPAADAPGRDDVAAVTVALTEAPADAVCLSVLARHLQSDLRARRTVDLAPGQSTELTLSGLPTGPITLAAQAFAVACADVGETSEASWVSETETLDLVSQFTPFVALTMMPAANANVAVDFQDAIGAAVEAVPLAGLPADRLAVTAEGAIVFTSADERAVSRLNGAGTVDLLWQGAGRPMAVALAPNGNIWFTESQPGRVNELSPDGVILSTYWMPGATPADLLIAGDGTVWVGIRDATRLVRITPGGGMQQLTIPGGSGVEGLDFAPDGTVIASLRSTSRAARYSAQGNLVNIYYLPTAGFDLRQGADGSMWLLTQYGGGVMQLELDGSTRLFPGPVPSLDSTIVSGPDGELYYSTQSPGRLVQFVIPEAYAVPVMLPVAVSPTGIAVGTDGRLWLADGVSNQLLAVTLPNL